ncbi:MAG: helix-turn-helix transcriptional regulator, partial [Phycicoccus sp.]
YAARDAVTTNRRVEPHRLVSLGRRWYLVAWDCDRQDWRSFRVDRVSSPMATGRRFRPRELPDGDAVAFVEAGFRRIPGRWSVRVRVAAPAERVREAVWRGGEVEPAADDACILTMNVESLDWPLMVLAQVGAPFEVETPDELRAACATVAGHFTAAATG